ncbi:MAG: response regulator transcription factor [Paludibacter sp.]|nr:response regulator transcription factor [Paludibacter sp.]
MIDLLKTTVNIIIADDHQMIIDGLKTMIGHNTGYNVVAESNDGQTAYKMIEDNPGNFGILLTDINMPGKNGIELCRDVKKMFPHVKVLILSMYDNAAIVKECIEAGADGFILKNAGRNELLDALYRISQNGSWFSNELIPIVYGQYEKEKSNRDKLKILTVRELEILKLIMQEYTSEEIARKLFISKKTVDQHRANILEKTGCRNTIALVKFGLANQI